MVELCYSAHLKLIFGPIQITKCGVTAAPAEPIFLRFDGRHTIPLCSWTRCAASMHQVFLNGRCMCLLQSHPSDLVAQHGQVCGTHV